MRPTLSCGTFVWLSTAVLFLLLGLQLNAQSWPEFAGESEIARSPSDLAEWFNQVQEDHLRLLPPVESPIGIGGGRVPFDPSSFSKSFVSRLDTVYIYEIAVHPVWIVEDETTRNRLIINSRGNVLAEVSAPASYDPWELVLSTYPGPISSAMYPLLDPSRLELAFELVASEDLETLQAYQGLTDSLMGLLGGGMMMGMSSGGTDVWFSAASFTTNGTLELTLSYPSNEVESVWEVFSYDSGTNVSETFDGYDRPWDLAETNLVLTGDVSTVWVDSGQIGRADPTNVTERYYVAANRDVHSDTDGLSDGRELFLYQTDPEDEDTDSDSVDDLTEVLQGRNPLAGAISDTGLWVNLEVFTPGTL